MIDISNIQVSGWEAATRGMRNPMNSWDKSDSHGAYTYNGNYIWRVGKNDLALMRKLAKAGTDDSKYLRMINVTCDIVAPLYWWSEYDTYKVGTVANSCSKMHKIHTRDLTLDDFSHEHLSPEGKEFIQTTIDVINLYRQSFERTKDKEMWWHMIQMLPSSYNQRRTVQLNYQVLISMYRARKDHKLDEWRAFCHWCETLPYFQEIFLDEDGE